MNRTTRSSSTTMTPTIEAPSNERQAKKSLTATADLLAKANTDSYDIIAIQEPYIDFLGNARSNPGWYSVHPKTHYIDRNKRTRSMILISRKTATNSWSTIDIGSPDVTAVKVKTQTGSVTIYNLYCDCTHSDSILDLKRHLQACTKDREKAKRTQKSYG